MSQTKYVTHLSYQKENGRSVLIVAKVVENLMAAGEKDLFKTFIENFDTRFKFGEVKHGTGKLRLFKINTVQNDYLTVEVYADDNLEAFIEYPFSGQRRTQFDEPLNKI